MKKEQIKNTVIETIQGLIDDEGLKISGEETFISLKKFNKGYDISEDFILDIEGKLPVKVFDKDWESIISINDAVELLTKYVKCRDEISKKMIKVLSVHLDDIKINECSDYQQVNFRMFESISQVQTIDDEIWKKCNTFSDVINLLTQVSCSNFEEVRKKQKFLHFFTYNQLK